MRRWLVRIGFALVVLFVLALIAAWIAMRASLPAMDGTRVLRGLAAPVTVRRDVRGVVTIEADNERDAIRALADVIQTCGGAQVPRATLNHVGSDVLEIETV